jgi:hypothetical protein
MKRRLLALLALLLPLLLQADEAKLARLASPPILSGKFVQEKKISGLSRPLVSRGDFLVDRGQGVIWRTLKPFDAAVAVTGKGIWSLSSLDGVVKREAIHQGNLGTAMDMIEKVLAGDVMSLKKFFKVTEGGTAEAWTLDLEPLDPVVARVIQRLRLQGSKNVDSVDYFEANGDSTHIVFSSVKPAAGPLGAWAGAAFGG